MRLLCALVTWFALTAAAADESRYAVALRQAERELERALDQEAVAGEAGTLGAWLKGRPDLRLQVECARACALISDERVLEDGGLEVDLSLPVRWLPGPVIAQLADPGRYLHATGTAPRRSRGESLSSEEYWSRRTLITTAYTAFRFTGMRREESERDALSRSRGESLDLLARALISLTLPDGRKLGGMVNNATDRVPLPPAVARPLRRTFYLVDRAESSVEVDYELPLAPLAESLGLGVEPSSRQAVPESARAAARRAALADFDARVPLWAGREAEVRAWLSTEGRRLAQSDTHALSYTHVYVVEIEIPQKEIPLSLNKRLYADSWFPLICRGYATW